MHGGGSLRQALQHAEVEGDRRGIGIDAADGAKLGRRVHFEK